MSYNDYKHKHDNEDDNEYEDDDSYASYTSREEDFGFHTT